MKELRQILAYFCIASLLAIVIPFFLLDNFWYSQPYISAEGLLHVLRNSTILEKAHILAIGSVIPLTIDLVWDFSTQTAEISAVAHIKERIAILMALAVFSLSFLCCRKLDSFPAVYVGANSVRANIVLTAMYYAVFPELRSKRDKFIDRGLLYVMMCSLVSNISVAYSVYFDSRIIGIASTFFQASVMIFFVYWFYRWVKLIAAKQNTTYIRFDQLSADESATLSYIIPLFIAPTMQLLYLFSSGMQTWQNLSEVGPIFHIAVIYTLHMALVLVPGRILQMLAVTKMNLLRLKQIFVRYMSHEIRSPLNVVHVGLEMLLSVINNSDPASPVFTIDRSTADFIKDMFFSSESAINLLNDLLQYEHIEAGTFRLSCNVLNIVNVLENKFAWANVWASQKGIAFNVKDTSLATEFGPVTSIAMADEESGFGVLSCIALAAQRNLTVNFDMSRIEQVIRNLITNAMKFTPIDGQVGVSISCELFNSSMNSAGSVDRFGKDAVGFLRVEVTDSGVGLSSEEQKKIFGEYSRFDIKELQGGGGSGLGLWISRRIVQMHNGIIGVTSAGHGFGSTFFFELPVFGPDYVIPALPQSSPSTREARSHFLIPSPGASEGDVATEDRSQPFFLQSDLEATSSVSEANHDTLSDSTVAQAEGELSCPAANTVLLPKPQPGLEPGHGTIEKCVSPGPLRMLIVDDSPLNCKVVARLIESEKAGDFAKATLLIADDGATAVQQLRTEMAAGRAVHYILMDYIMTTMHGPDAARIMRDELQFRGAIIGITGNALPDDIEYFNSCGANHVITKPLTKAKLMDALHRILPVAMKVEE